MRGAERLGKRLQRSLGLLAAIGLSACISSSEPKPHQRFAIIVTDIAPPIVGAFPVRLTAINGEAINGGTELRLRPGVYQIQAEPLVDDSFVSHRMNTTPRPTIPLVSNFESGTRYYLASQPSEADASQMQVVIWRTKETGRGLLNIE